MWYKGIVIELLKNDVAILLTDEGEFVKVKQKQGMEVGQTILFLDQDKIINQAIPFTPKKKKFIPIFAAIAAMLLVFLIPNVKQQTAYAILSVDINPSFELELDETLTIVGIKTLNDSANQLVLEQVKGMNLEQGLQIIRNVLSEANYSLTQDSILFSLAFLGQEDLDYETSVKESLKIANMSQEFAYLKVSSEELELAHEQQMSGAKMKVQEMLEDIDVEELSINQIIQLFEDSNLKFDMRCYDGEELEDLLDDLEDQWEDSVEDKEDDKDDRYSASEEENDDDLDWEEEEEEDDDDDDEDDHQDCMDEED